MKKIISLICALTVILLVSTGHSFAFGKNSDLDETETLITEVSTNSIATNTSNTFSFSISDIPQETRSELFFYYEICSFDVTSENYSGKVYVFAEKSEGQYKIFFSDDTGKSLLEKSNIVKLNSYTIGENDECIFKFDNEFIINDISIMDGYFTNIVFSGASSQTDITENLSSTASVTDENNDLTSDDDNKNDESDESKSKIDIGEKISSFSDDLDTKNKVIIILVIAVVVVAVVVAVLFLIKKRKGKKSLPIFVDKSKGKSKIKNSGAKEVSKKKPDKKDQKKMPSPEMPVRNSSGLNTTGTATPIKKSFTVTLNANSSGGGYIDISSSSKRVPPTIGGEPKPVSTSSESTRVVTPPKSHQFFLDYYAGKCGWKNENSFYITCTNTDKIPFGSQPEFKRGDKTRMGYVLVDNCYIYLYSDDQIYDNEVKLYDNFGEIVLSNCFEIFSGNNPDKINGKAIIDIKPAVVKMVDGDRFVLERKGVIKTK